jgi:hypothetical protein
VINKEPRFVWPNTDEGAPACWPRSTPDGEIMPRLPRVFSRIPKTGMEIRRVPPAIEQGAPGGYAQRLAGRLASGRLLHQPQGHGRVAQVGRCPR